ncbi:GNAT family N-acetyltransferase [Natronohydrobacter thiooxidans]|uniref:GNAT family N-acetyltransferase n=1 Tax=Natronohydrobacter thiooxidans TaxID=87172 RepID=UPI00158755CC|nr:GNAT family N-acetyltransferase [Natronohydrobacter thiooxidans]
MPDDVSALHELSVSVGWPHRARDLATLIEIGEGFLACDEIGRAAGSAMCFPMGEGFATIGMMVTTPRLQHHGAGRWLLRKVMERCAGRELRLNATQQAYRLYQSEGFIPVRTIRLCEGIARNLAVPPAPSGTVLRAAGRQDIDIISALDLAAFGADRGAIFRSVFPECEGLILERAGTPVGFALVREFGRGWLIGPVVAPDETAARALIAPLVIGHAGRFVRIDIGQEYSALRSFLHDAGLAETDKVTSMVFGPNRAGRTPGVFALMSHTLG